MQEVLTELGRKRLAVIKLEDSLNKKLKEVDRQSVKLKTSVANQGISGTAREAQLQSEVDKCMVRFEYSSEAYMVLTAYILQSLLKCSTCKMNMRNTVITKCMHCMYSASNTPWFLF